MFRLFYIVYSLTIIQIIARSLLYTTDTNFQVVVVSLKFLCKDFTYTVGLVPGLFKR